MRKKVFYIILLIIAVVLFPSLAFAGSPGKLVLISLDGLSFEELTELGRYPNFERVFKEGSVALMNNNTGGGLNSVNAYLTIGSGAHLRGGETGRLAFNYGEQYDGQEGFALYRTFFGKEPSGEAVVNLGAVEAERESSSLKYPFKIGLIGEELKKRGLKTLVVGNADAGKEYFREITLLTMDKTGVTPLGLVNREVLKKDQDFPGGLRSDYDKIYTFVTDNWRSSDLVVIETGDIARVDYFKNLLFDREIKRQKTKVFKEVDAFLGKILSKLNPKKDALIIFTPYPSRDMLAKKDYLGFAVAWGRGFGPGLLTSGTTKRPGLITNLDLTATILTFYGIKPPVEVFGRSVQGISKANALNFLKDYHNQILITYNLRPPLVKSYITVLIITLLYGLFGLYYKKVKGLDLALLFLFTVPLTFLWLSLFYTNNLILNFLIAVLLNLALVVLAKLLNKLLGIDSFAVIGIITFASLIFDLLNHQELIRRSVLGYDPMAGARYYGIGNEYMGILVGVTLYLASHYGTRLKKKAYVLYSFVFLAVYLLISSPSYGANFGGALTALFGFTVFLALFLNIRFNVRNVLILLGAVMAGLIAVYTYDAFLSTKAQSHVARAIQEVRAGGLSVLTGIIIRKVAMNIKLIKYTIWSRVFLTSLLALAFSFYRPLGYMNKIKTEMPIFYKGLVAILVASVAALIFNDSGIVAAATTMNYSALPLLYQVLLFVREGEK
ncbi:hypothetical protein [Carboxydothermus hydrogenoformans]|uniref:Putative membrane protein n=1 Tax=Carboxydothermus hydrogenoformans (strain ATCC BAA-161 / DSM 6008 / Z-2901) TaxID=246194 RepID=Q3AB51_CARHZ|nr:hypothetical protein [Carboxydothermus hydrogenoformans]ABB14790.1 putative membrane protein [Carboxydothermus hydrogenoformans Z-2901]